MDGTHTEARLRAAGFQVVADSGLLRHALVARGSFAALVEKDSAGYGHAGSAGLMTEHGLAVLVWRGERACFTARGFERTASPAEVAQLRAFSAELGIALESGGLTRPPERLQ